MTSLMMSYDNNKHKYFTARIHSNLNNISMGRISYEEKMRIQTLYEQRLGAKAIRSRCPAKQWSLNTLKTICRHITKTGSAVTHQCGSRRPKSARTAQNTAAVGDMICSQEDQPGTSKKFLSDCQNAWNERQIRSAHRENGS